MFSPRKEMLKTDLTTDYSDEHNQAAGRPRGRLPKAARRARRVGTSESNNAEANAGTPDVRAGGVFAGPLTSALADGPSKTPLHSLRD